ncbi:MAG: hypothetical protein AAFQ94_27110 [Bacteroidota bacterium]
MKHLIFLIILFLSHNLSAQEGFVDKILTQEYQDSVKSHPLGSISHNYTLTLSGWYDDCGEFGGHLETIEIKKIDGRLIAEVIIYKKNCKDKKENRVKRSKQYSVDDSDIKLITGYLDELQSKTLGYNVISNAGCRYKARMGFSEADENTEQWTRLKLNHVDNYCEWSAFEQLKNSIENQ